MLSLRPFILLLPAVALLAACENDPTDVRSEPPVPSRAVIGSGDVGEGFLMRAQGNSDEGLGFLLRGSDLRTEGGSLLVDVVVKNDGRDAVAAPAALTLVTLDPPTVVVVGADNGETGAGASFDLVFEDGDDRWEVGESSAPRTLEFDVEPGIAIAFVARIDVAMSESGGAIGGTVFADRDRDGVFDAGEGGVFDVRVTLDGEAIGSLRTRTSSDGTYRFDGLPAGAYAVRTEAGSGSDLTSATTIQVLLAGDGQGGVTDYLSANFGVAGRGSGGGGFMPSVGDRVEVDGRYDVQTGRFLAREVERDDDEADFELDGPVTAVDREAGQLEVMGVALDVSDARSRDDDWLDDCDVTSVFDLRVGDLVEVDGDDRADGLHVDDVDCETDAENEIEGRIESIDVDGDGRLRGFTILGVRIDVDARTEFEGDDDDDNDDDDDDDDRS